MKNLFQILGITENFVIDSAALEQIYFRKQQEFHPDRQAGKDAATKQKSILASMEINHAYHTLKSPLLRAQHLLALRDIIVNTDGKDSIKPTPELLMEMMTLREELADCTNAAGWEKLYQHGIREFNSVLENLTRFFNDNDYTKAALETLRLRYLEKFLEEIRIIKTQRFG